MQSFTVGVNEAGQRLDKYLSKILNQAPKSFLYKMLRKKNIVLNGKKADGSEKTAIGDVVSLYLADATIAEFSKREEIPGLKEQKGIKIPSLSVIYEDENVLFFNKPQGLLSQKASAEDISAVECVTEHLLKNGKITKEQLRTFHPSVANRLDRNTSGILTAGISLAGSQELAELFKTRNLDKYYLCLVKGILTKEQHLKGYLKKNEKTNQVKIYEKQPDAEALPIETAYFPLAHSENMTLLLVDLLTGRSHQIRAHLASIGHPIAGDEKYGVRNWNKELKEKYGIKCQMLHAYHLHFRKMEGALQNLSEKDFYAEPPENFKRVLKGEKIKWQPGRQED